MNATLEAGMQKTVERRQRGECRRVRILAGYMEWRLTAADTGGHYCVLETFAPPGAGIPPHQHVDQEAFYIVEGTLEFARLGPGGLEWFPVVAGDSIHVPSNEVHGSRNTGTARARILVTATAGLAAFFEEAGVPIPPGAPAPAGPPSAAEIERVLTIASKHGHRFLRP
jgi:quercetin dioxygenase-like cupin family protein